MSESPDSRSGGGIVFGGGARSSASSVGDPANLVAALRRRWASGIAIVTAVDVDGGLRGITATSVMVVSQDPAVIAVALTASGSFHRLAEPSAILGISILEADHEFMAERFAGRAPVPDAGFAGVPHRMAGDVPILDGALGWCQGPVWSCEEIGDHVLVLVDVTQGDLGPDTDDPLLSYEGRYRRLEAG